MATTGAGPAEREVQRLGRRCAGALRVAVAACASLLALVAAPTGSLALDVGIAVALNAWAAAYFLLLSRGAGNRLLIADAAVVAAACLTQRWTVAPAAWHGSTSWIVGIASVAVAAWQWHSNARGGATATAVVVVAYLTGSGGVSAAAVFVVLWLGVEAVLSRGLYRLLERGARAADRITAEAARARRESAVAAAPGR